MARYYVQRVEDESGKLLGWVVFNAAGVKVSGPFGTEVLANDEAQRLEALDLALEAAQKDILLLAAEHQVEAKAGGNGTYCGRLLGMNEHYVLVDAGRYCAHYILREPIEDAGIDLEVDTIMRFQLHDGEAIPQRPRSRGASHTL